MSTLRDAYAEAVISQVPRLLSLQDRNPFSPTYGSFKRTYWLDKATDFVDAQPQFACLTLACVYHYDMPGNIYKDQPKMLEWILASMRYWVNVQHRDGSFDEFYPNEHGWTGPTGFLLYAMVRTYMILEERGEFPEDFRQPFFDACRKAARYIIAWDEQGVLANHHALAVLSVYYAYHILGDEDLKQGYEKKLKAFLQYHTDEGWSLEYDGADPGYLSATVSFLAKVYKLNNDPRLKEVIDASVEFLSYFVYPNGHYAGSIGSRQTLHFYSHGVEIVAGENPLAGRIADAMLNSLSEGKIVSGAFQSDRYCLFRTAEHAESFIDYTERSATAPLPYEREDFTQHFPKGRFFIQKKNDRYIIGSGMKGGVLKVFDIPSGTQLLSDCGIIGKTLSGTVLTSNWVDSTYTFDATDDGFTVSGTLHTMPANKLFTPIKLIIFRLFTLLFCWNTTLAYHTKGLIRKVLMLKSGSSSVTFRRTVKIGDRIDVETTINIKDNTRLSRLQIGDEFFVRYVPQSRYFQAQEFDASGYLLSDQELKKLHTEGSVTIRHSL